MSSLVCDQLADKLAHCGQWQDCRFWGDTPDGRAFKIPAAIITLWKSSMTWYKRGSQIW
jgi:hypothetical protein